MPNQWQATTDLRSDDLLPERLSVRIVENHTQNGNRTLDQRSVEIRGTDGHFEPYQDIENETLTIDSSTVRTTTRTFGRDVNGARTLLQVTEEEKRSLPGGNSTVLRVTRNPDLNGKLQPVQREIVETKKQSEDLQEINTTVMLPNINGGLAPAFKTHELRKRHPDGTTESQKTTLLADGTGKWVLNETRHVTSNQEGTNSTVEEHVFRRDAEGKLPEVSRTVKKESDDGSGEEKETTATYSVDVPGVTRDGGLHLIERAATVMHTSAAGERKAEQRVEQINAGDPAAGLRVSILVKEQMVPASETEHGTVTIRARDSNGNFSVVSVDTTKADIVPKIQIQQTPTEHTK